MEIRIFGLADDSIVDGPGVRYTVFVQGCPHHCPGCHNPASHDFAGGTLMDTDGIIRKIGENPLLDGVTLSGGEPMCQPEACRAIADAAHAKHLNVWPRIHSEVTLFTRGTEGLNLIHIALLEISTGLY